MLCFAVVFCVVERYASHLFAVMCIDGKTFYRFLCGVNETYSSGAAGYAAKSVAVGVCVLMPVFRVAVSRV